MYKMYDNSLIGYHEFACNNQLLFSGHDSEELLNTSLKTQPSDWYYRNNPPITYQRNKSGHRSKNIEDIDLDNYFIVTGCSLTEGIGVHLEDTYAYRLSQKLKCDYYNLGLGGTGMDITSYNLLTWLSTVKQKPKFIIVQTPEDNRFSLEQDSKIVSYGSWSVLKRDWRSSPEKEFLLVGSEIRHFSARRKLLNLLIKNTTSVPIIDILLDKYLLVGQQRHEVENPYILMPAGVDNGRDMLHPGKESNELLALSILEKIKGI